MAEKDVAEKTLEAYNDVFADIRQMESFTPRNGTLQNTGILA